MDPRFDHGRSRSSENIGGPLRMPAIPDPNHPPQLSPPQLYSSASQPSLYDDFSRTRTSLFEHNDQDYDYDAEAQLGGNYQEQPYQEHPQDIPLLFRNSSQPQYFEQHQDDPDIRRTATPLGPEAPFATTRGGTADGHLVYDCPVPPKLLRNIPHAQAPARDEFTHMRYTAATCDPADFVAENFTLRPQLFTQRRRTELFIVVTMYNEDDVLFARTMTGVFKNIEYMCSLKGRHKGLWDENGWKKIVVCIVVDGRSKLDARTRAVMTALGVYQHGVAVQQVNKKDVTAHIYEYTTKVGIEVRKGIVETKPGIGPSVQMIFCLKEKNQKKINSHRWALQAFGGALQPNICVLLDAGTRPGNQSIYQLWRAFELDKNCGGACGEIKAMLGKGKGWEKLLNPIIAAQNFEYKMSNILDKPMESAFGFISVLPGAFSAYRFTALQNDAKGKGPLEKYFDGEKHHLDAGIFTKNMYLAEDRILCFELVAKRKSSWVLTYVCSASGETDVPEEMPELIKQRRRWLNGSFFAAVYALVHFYQIFRSSHSMVRKIMFMIEFLYQTISMIFAWFAVGNFFLVFRILVSALGDPSLLGKTGDVLSVIIEWIYLASLVACFVLSLGNTPDGSRRFYMTMVYSWGLIMLYLLFASVFITIKSVESELHQKTFTWTQLFSNELFFTLIVSLLSTYILWIFISIVFFDPWHILTSTVQYLLLSPTYINVINVYAFCNTHDVTWGTKGDDKPEKLKGATVTNGQADTEPTFDDGDLNALYDTALEKFATEAEPEVKKKNTSEEELNYNRAFRTYVVLAWMFSNAALVAIVLNAGGLQRLKVQSTTTVGDEESNTVKVYLFIVLWSVAGLSAFKFVGAMWYKIHRMFVR
ncbi:chitin synthase 1 [Acephala macrosclerotiorum]|nr:chitin synthase 1 [Acephala macrosclerotiorum]